MRAEAYDEQPMPELHSEALDFRAASESLEVVSDHRGDTFRSVYTVRSADRVFVLHAFQKKSKSGVATLKAYIDLIKRRLKQATEISRKKE